MPQFLGGWRDGTCELGASLALERREKVVRSSWKIEPVTREEVRVKVASGPLRLPEGNEQEGRC